MPLKIKLTKEQLANLDQAERLLTDLSSQVDKAEACGDDCRAHRHNIEEALRRIRAYKQHFSK